MASSLVDCGLAAAHIEVPAHAPEDVDFARRFGGIARLYGTAALERFRRANVCVVGIGGVGSWAAEALARSAIGAMTLIDLDHIAESNVNRQVHAMGGEFGKAKVRAMAERIRAINPLCAVREIEDFVSETNVAAVLGGDPDFVIDAIDNVRAKAALAAHCRYNGVPLVTCGGAGGQLDPTRIRIDDLSRTAQDPLLAKVRKRLRQEYGFPRARRHKFGIDAVYSDEPLIYPTADGGYCDEPPAAAAPTGLNCAGFGSTTCVTAAFGLVAVSLVLKRLVASAA